MANTVCWFDLGVANLERARQFYSKVLNKKLEVMNEHGFTFVVFPHEENSNDVAGCLVEIPNFKPSNTELVIYFDVDGRLQDAVAQVTQHGGQILTPVESIGPWGFRAVITDSEGNKVALYSRNNN